jgi:hypothetical protein
MKRRVLWIAVLLVLFMGSRIVVVPALGSPVDWTSPVRADDRPPFASPAAIAGVSCPSTSLCVAVDTVGDVLVSADPTGGTEAWTRTYMGKDSTAVESFTGVSCPSMKLCVAVDSEGDVVTSTDPAGGGGAWTRTEVIPHSDEGESDRLEAVSCPSESLCVVTDDRGDVVTSADPTGGASAWTAIKVTSPNQLGGGNALGALSCPSVRLCVATASEGNMVSATDPTGGRDAWTETNVDGDNELFGVSCASESLCIASDDYGDILTATEPTGGKSAWTAAHVSTGSIEHVSCASWGLCVALDRDEVVTSLEPSAGASAWTATPIDIANMSGGQYSLESAACPSPGLCVLGDDGGAVVSTTEPTKGASAWTVSDLEVGSSGLLAVSCATEGLCAGVDDAGNVVTSTDPSGGAGAWSEAHVDTHALDSVSCPSAGLCVAVDNAGDILTSTDPTGGAGAWSIVDADGSRPFESVSCPSQSMCVATANEGYVVTSTDPTGGADAWSVTKIAEGFLGDVSCPSVELCVAIIDGSGEIATSTEPGVPKASAWTLSHLTEAVLNGVSCSSAGSCVIVGLGNIVLASTDPTGGTSAWSMSYIEGLNGLAGVSCEAADLCVATAFAGNGSPGNVIASTNPVGGAGSWVTGNVYGLPVRSPFAPFELYIKDLGGVSCASRLCVVVDAQGDVIVGTQSPIAPVNSSVPLASGTPTPGQTLSCSNGSWTGDPPPSFTYQWLRDGEPIGGASASVYEVQTADQGHGLACQVTAGNSAGSESATSNILQVPPAQTPGGGDSGGGSSGGSDSPGTLTGTMSNPFALNDVESVAAHGTVRITLTLPGPGTLQIVGKASAAQLAVASHTKKRRKTPIVIVRLRLTVSKAGHIVVTLAPTASAKTVLVKRGKLRATITIVYTPRGGAPRSIVRAVNFWLKRRR